MGRRMSGMVNGWWGDNGRTLLVSPFLLCWKVASANDLQI
jgi:hypothetical protein